MEAQGADSVIVDAVTNIRDRFGAHGLRDLIALARHELDQAEDVLRQLADEA